MTNSDVVQLHGGRWPSGDARAIAILPAEPGTIAAQLHLEFSGGVDDLGPYEAAGIRTATGRQMLFLRHEYAPMAGTTVYADVQDDFREALDEVLALLDLDRSALPWTG
jgi:hypothetical protein